MQTYTLTVAQAMACLTILTFSALLLNEMTSRTPHWRKLLYVLLVSGAGVGLARSFVTPDVKDCITAAALAALVLYQWRITHAHPGAAA